MSNVDQLLAKAMSTASEEEAIACLRMARKRGSTVSAQPKSTEDVSYWRNKAEYYYNMAVKLQQVARLSQQNTEMWHNNYRKSEELRRTASKEKTEVEHRLFFYKLALGFVVPFAVMSLVVGLSH